ncbi:MAG: hypothetical protein WAS73_00680 [Defluviicoccus sp.]
MRLTRRTFTGRAVRASGFVLGLVPLARIQFVGAQTSADEAVSFRWRVPAAHYHTVQDSLVFDGKVEQERDTKGLPLVAVLVGVAMLPSLADAVLTLRRKLVQPGLKIDVRGPEIKIEIDPTLPRGMILLVDGSGAKLYEPNQLTVPAELAKAIAAAMSK